MCWSLREDSPKLNRRTRRWKAAMEERLLRERIAYEAAILLRNGHEKDVWSAKRRASRIIGVRVKRHDIPSNGEIREQMRRLELIEDAGAQPVDPRLCSLVALRWMRLLHRFHPSYMVPSAATKTSYSDFALALFADRTSDVLAVLESKDANVVSNTVRNGGALKKLQPRRLEIKDEVCGVLFLYPEELYSGHSQRSNEIPQGMTIQQLEDSLSSGHSLEELEREVAGIDAGADRFEYFHFLLDRLDGVEQDPRTHPEGDALYHSLQVYDLGVLERPYDEEFLTAALLHDVGKALTEMDSLGASLGLLAGFITNRTAWLIGNLPHAKLYRERTLEHVDRVRLQQSEDFDDLMLLMEINKRGRQSGVETSTVEEAIHFLRSLDAGDAWK